MSGPSYYNAYQFQSGRYLHISYHMVAMVIWRNISDPRNLYHTRHTCITRDVVEDNTSVSRVIHVFEGHIISLYHPGNHVITTLSPQRNHRLLLNFMET